MSSKGKSSTSAGDGEALVPKLRFPEFQYAAAWDTAPGDELFQQVSNREAPPGLPILAITQEHGAIPRHMIDYNVSVTDKSLETYKEVRPGDFIISLRSFQGGIEFSEYHGICSPAYVILRKRGQLYDRFYRQHFKSHAFIQQLTRNLEGLRDGKMISYKQFSELQLLKPTLSEQQKIADCLDAADALIAAQGRKVEALRAHKKGLMQQLFPQEGETQPRLRFPEFEGAGEWEEKSVSDFGQVVTGSTPSTADPSLYGGGIPFVSPADISELRYVDETRTTLTAAGFKKTRPIRAGSVLFVCIGSTIGKIAQNVRECATNQQINAVIPNARHSGGFVYFALSNATDRITLLAGKQAVPIINKSLFSSVRLLVPRLPEQQRIADCLTSLDKLIAAETRKLDMLKTHKKGLMQQLFPVIEEPQS